MSNRRQMYNSRYSAMRSVPNSNSGNVNSETNCASEKSEQNCECDNLSMPYMMDRVGGATKGGCGCNEYYVKDEIAGFPLGMAYVPWQAFCNLYDEHTAFHDGTIFKDLDLDFYGRRCK